MTIKRNTFIILLFLFALPFLVELSSKLVITIYNFYFLPNKINNLESNFTKNDNKSFVRYSEDVVNDVDKAISESYYYESYVVWKYKAYTSKHANLDNQGYRLNNKDQKKVNISTDKKNIWFVGGTEVFGYRNSDENTLPSNLERALNVSNNKNYFSVKNMGQLSYVSMQTFLSLRFELMNNFMEKPDLIILLNGFDDYKNYWKVGHLYSTDFYTHDFLSKYWKMHNEQSLIDKEKLKSLIITKYFYNTNLLLDKIDKYFKIKKYNKDIDSWKKNYIKFKENKTKSIEKNLESYYSFYLSNIKDIAILCNENNIELLLLHTPTLFTTDKKLVGHEIDDYNHVGNYFFSMKSEDIKDINEVPSYQVNRKWYWDKKIFKKGYYNQKNLLINLAKEMKVNFLDLDKVVSRNNLAPIFENFANPTDYGNKIYAEAIQFEVLKILD